MIFLKITRSLNRKIFRLHCYTPLNMLEKNVFLRLTQGSDYE